MRPAGTVNEDDIEIAAQEILHIREKLNGIVAKHTGQPKDTIRKDTERDNFMTGDEAKEYGLIDNVITNRLDAHKDKGKKDKK